MPALTNSERQAKLQRLAELLGFKTIDEMFDAVLSDTACPGICINPWCEYTATVAPDENAGFCQNDGTKSVHSALILAGALSFSTSRPEAAFLFNQTVPQPSPRVTDSSAARVCYAGREASLGDGSGGAPLSH
jgi:hypothetical protein